jgi:hypothetical protein
MGLSASPKPYISQGKSLENMPPHIHHKAILGIDSAGPAGCIGMLFGYTVTYSLVYRNANTVDGHCIT